MSIEILGPFSGRPVKIRPQDVGKAVRDEENRIFYVLKRPDGDGYYSAPSKAGGQRDIDRYDKYLARMGGAKQTAAEQSKSQITVERRRARRGSFVKFLILAAILAGGAYAAFKMGFIGGGGGEPQP